MKLRRWRFQLNSLSVRHTSDAVRSTPSWEYRCCKSQRQTAEKAGPVNRTLLTASLRRLVALSCSLTADRSALTTETSPSVSLSASDWVKSLLSDTVTATSNSTGEGGADLRRAVSATGIHRLWPLETHDFCAFGDLQADTLSATAP